MSRTFDENGPGERYDSCICFQDEHHNDCPAIVKGTCHYQDYYKAKFPRREIITLFKSEVLDMADLGPSKHVESETKKEKTIQVDPLFQVHILNKEGIDKAQRIARAFNDLLRTLNEVCAPGRERSLVYTKLEEAAFFAKKSMASQDENQLQTDPALIKASGE